MQCPKGVRYRNEIYQAIKQLGKEIDPVLHDILLDDMKQYHNGTSQTKHIVSSKCKPKIDYWGQICEVRREPERTTEVEEDTDDYWQLQRNQEAIGWDNSLQGKKRR